MGLACQSIVHDEDGQPKHPSPSSHRENSLLFQISRPESAGTSGGYSGRDKSSRIPANFLLRRQGHWASLPLPSRKSNVIIAKSFKPRWFSKGVFLISTAAIVRGQPHSPLSVSRHSTRNLFHQCLRTLFGSNRYCSTRTGFDDQRIP